MNVKLRNPTFSATLWTRGVKYPGLYELKKQEAPPDARLETHGQVFDIFSGNWIVSNGDLVLIVPGTTMPRIFEEVP